MTRESFLARETLIKSNSELFKEGYDEVMYKKYCKI